MAGVRAFSAQGLPSPRSLSIARDDRLESRNYIVVNSFNRLARIQLQNSMGSNSRWTAVPTAGKGGAMEDLERQASWEADATDRMYVVGEDDSLSSIARKFYGTATARRRIIEANRSLIHDPYLIQPGWRLRIPA
jgi:LysM domain-containing protein